jgi:hypothetical protein
LLCLYFPKGFRGEQVLRNNDKRLNYILNPKRLYFQTNDSLSKVRCLMSNIEGKKENVASQFQSFDYYFYYYFYFG